VLVSDQTPWRGLAEKGIGWDLPLTSEVAFRDAIQRIVNMDEPEHAAMRTRARAYALAATDPKPAIEQNRAMFLSALRS
ncbi:MAG: group 1 family glycosyltransferase, partial [Thermoanaerobaculia bacterium]